ncbi:MAG: hypothetical protein ABWW63_06540 [Glaciecola sp.]|jgi:hypothetical protein
MSALAELYQENDFQSVLHAQDIVTGIIYGVSMTPEIPMPEQWIGWTLANADVMQDAAKMERIGDALMNALANTLQALAEHDLGCAATWEYDANSQSVNAPCQLFLVGLLLAHEQSQDVWQSAWDKLPEVDKVEQANHLTHCLNMFSTFVDVDQALARAGENADTLAQALPQIFTQLPSTLLQYNELSGLLGSYLPEQFACFATADDD